MVLLELPLKRQVVSIQNYLANINLKSFNVISDAISIRLNELAKFKRAEILEYYKVYKKEIPYSNVVNKMAGIMAIQEVPKSLSKVIQEAPQAINPLIIQYGDMMTELQDIWFKFKAPLSMAEYRATPLEDFHLLCKRYFEPKDKTVSYYISLIDSFHEELRDGKFVRPESFFLALQEYNNKARAILSKIKFERNRENFILETNVNTLKNQYKHIYGYEMDLSEVSEY